MARVPQEYCIFNIFNTDKEQTHSEHQEHTFSNTIHYDNCVEYVHDTLEMQVHSGKQNSNIQQKII